MEHFIAKLLEDFEHGKITRRQLVQGLALAATATVTAGAVVPAGDERRDSLRWQSITFHISSPNHAKTRDFYADLFGLKVVADTGKQCHLVLNDSNTSIIPRNAPPGVTPPRIDHIAYTIAGWNKSAVEGELKRRGLDPRPDSDNSFHVTDPNGFDLQISGKDIGPGMNIAVRSRHVGNVDGRGGRILGDNLHDAHRAAGIPLALIELRFPPLRLNW